MNEFSYLLTPEDSHIGLPYPAPSRSNNRNAPEEFMYCSVISCVYVRSIYCAYVRSISMYEGSSYAVRTPFARRANIWLNEVRQFDKFRDHFVKAPIELKKIEIG